jgi:hypothetical protein
MAVGPGWNSHPGVLFENSQSLYRKKTPAKIKFPANLDWRNLRRDL